MTEQALTMEPADASCDRPTSITKSLLAYGVIAGPFFILVSLTQAVSRDGFDLARHQWSLLSNGGLGWIQIANFALTGLMTLAFAVGLRRALSTGRGGTWAPRLIGVYGVSLVGAGVFRADPALGFPPGTEPGMADVSWHGVAHFVCGAIGFAALIAACFVVGSHFAADAERHWATYSRTTGAVFLAGFGAVAAGAGAVWANLAFTVAVVVVWSWLSALAAHLYRRPVPGLAK